ncbi:MAG: hypothetical protein CM15mP74_29390 [Halieaceae bacterium]|nr:MAG: hypothetical protein CM15mP74_29390 [Halieaceae bacterium]
MSLVKARGAQGNSCATTPFAFTAGGLVITAPLEGIRVVEMTSVVLGPYACQMLGDLGADVVKIEPLAGDTNRNLGPHANDPKMSALFLTCNRNKRSVALDLKSDAGERLPSSSSRRPIFVVHNFRPQAMERLGLDYEQVKAVNPTWSTARPMATARRSLWR